MPGVGLITDPEHSQHQHPDHIERPARVDAILQHLDHTGLRRRLAPIALREATDEELLAVHEQQLIDRVHDRADAGGGWIDLDTYVQPKTPRIARRAAGAAVVAVEAVLAREIDRVFVATRPPGHHATRGASMGFCLYNNVAVAAAAALRSSIDRVAIVDWDVHHGNGTQDIFDRDPRVLYASTHAAPFYPGTGDYTERGRDAASGTKVNVPLPHGTGDSGFIRAFEEIIVPALERFAPELMLISCGWDSHQRDPLGTLAVTTEGYHRAAYLVREAAARYARNRMIVVLEGGYDTHALAWCASGLVQLLLGDEPARDPQPGGRMDAMHDLTTHFHNIALTIGLR